jgi:2-dehydropantoate 2-reductase
MKICVYGAGAIGGYLGAELARTDCEVTLIARGPHLDAMRDKGLTLLIGDEKRRAEIACTDDPASIGPQDYVFITLKAHSVAPILDQIAPLLGKDTAVVTAQNGILWWYFYRFPGPLENHHLQAADPGGQIWRAIGPERAIGCVVYPSCEIVEPGVVRHISSNRFMLGEPDGTKSERARILSGIMTDAGLKAPVRTRIRDDIWLKLWGNATFNPVSALTGATLEEMANDEEVNALIRAMMLECERVATKLGVKFPVDIEKRIDGARRVGAHKTSMLQDLENGRPLEIDALVTVVSELGQLVDVPTPMLDAVLSLLKLKVGVAQIS